MMKIFSFKRSRLINHNFNICRLSKNFTLIHKSFCSKTEEISSGSSFNEEELRQINNLKDFIDFYSQNKNFIEKELDKKLIFFEFYAQYIENIPRSKLTEIDYINFNKIICDEIIQINFHNLKTNSLYTLSLIETLSKLNFYKGVGVSESENKYDELSGNNLSKLWIHLEYMILRTDFLKTIDFTNFDILLKAFQNFFSIKNTTISSEEIFEAIEYELILRLKNKNEKFYPTQIEKLSEIYILYGKNLEASAELYNLFIKKVFTPENLEQISKHSSNLFLGIYFSSILLKTYVISHSNKNFHKFFNQIEQILEKSNMNYSKLNLNPYHGEESQALKIWCRLKMKMLTKKSKIFNLKYFI